MRTPKEIRYDVAYMNMAKEWAKLSHATRNKVGALIVQDGRIISDGYNGTPAGFSNECEDDTNTTHWYVLHAEANAILKCARSTNSCVGSTLYITLSPCKQCCKLIVQSGIQTVIFGEKYRDTTGIDFLTSAGVNVIHHGAIESHDVPVPEWKDVLNKSCC